MHYLAEGVLIAVSGASGSVFLALTVTPAIVSLAANHLPRAEEIAVDWTVLLFALGAAGVASVLSSVAPLRQAVRIAPADVLGEGVRASAGRRSRRASQSLVVVEIALAFSLLAVSSVLLFHLRNLSRVSPGFEADDLLTFAASLPGTIADDPDTRIPLQQRLVDSLRVIPGVEEVAFANQLPFKGCCWPTAIYVEGRTLDASAGRRTSLMAVSVQTDGEKARSGFMPTRRRVPHPQRPRRAVRIRRRRARVERMQRPKNSSKRGGNRSDATRLYRRLSRERSRSPRPHRAPLSARPNTGRSRAPRTR